MRTHVELSPARALRAAAALLLALAAGAAAASAVTGAHARPARAAPAAADSTRVLRVCADPNNLPFSNRAGEGFENRLAELVAREMHARLEYVWWAQRRGFFRNTLNAGLCDVVPGVPASLDMVATTRPYYRSSYVFLSRRDRGLRLGSFDDPTLRRLKIGVQLVGDDGANPPPVHALDDRGLGPNLVGYSVWGDYRQPNPPARIVDAVAAGEVDAAVVWGPLAGYFARRSPVPLVLVPVSPQADSPARPFAFDIAMGVRHRDRALRDTLDAILERRAKEVGAILDRYGVPRVAAGARRVSS